MRGTCLYVRSASVGHCFHICVFQDLIISRKLRSKSPTGRGSTRNKIPTQDTATRGSTCGKKVIQVTATRGSTCYNPRKFGNSRLIGMTSLAVLLIQLCLWVSLGEGFLHIARHHHHTSPASPNSNSTVSRVKRAETNTGLSTYLLFEISLDILAISTSYSKSPQIFVKYGLFLYL
jgi:hypothetical protein